MPRQVKYRSEEEKNSARVKQQQLRRDKLQAEQQALSIGRPAKYSDQEAAREARNERRRLRRQSQRIERTDKQEHIDVINNLQSLSIQEYQHNGSFESIEHNLNNTVAPDSSQCNDIEINKLGEDVWEDIPQDDFNQVSPTQDHQSTQDEANTTQNHISAENRTTVAQREQQVQEEEEEEEESIQEKEQPIQVEELQIQEEDLQIQEEEQLTQKELQAQEESDYQNEEEVEEESDYWNEEEIEEEEDNDDNLSVDSQDGDLGQSRVEMETEAREATAKHIHAIASHRCYNHTCSTTSVDGSASAKSLWDVAQHTQSLLRLQSRNGSDGSTFKYDPLENQSIPYIRQFNSVSWNTLYSDEEPPHQSRGRLSFKLSQDEALRRCGGTLTLQRRWDVDSVIFRTTTLGVFNEGAELCFYPAYNRSITQNPNIVIDGCKIQDCKNTLLAHGGASMIRWDCHLIIPGLPKTGRHDTQQLSHKTMCFWTDKILLPAIRKVCDSDRTNHLPRSFNEIRNKAWVRGEATVVNHYQRALPNNDHDTESIGLRLSKSRGHTAITSYLQQEDLDSVWIEMLSIIQQGVAAQEDMQFMDFKACFLVVSSHGTKMATKGRDHTLSSVRDKFHTMIDRAFDTRPETIPREDFFVDNGHEITPESGSGLVLLRKSECLDHMLENYVCPSPESGKRRVHVDNWTWAFTTSVGTTKITTSPTNMWRKGGFTDTKAYNLNKDVFSSQGHGVKPFSESRLEGLAFDSTVLNQWLEHNKQGSSQHGGAGPRTRQTLLDILKQTKRRVTNALEDTKHETFGVRAEDRVNIELYDRLEEPDSSWLSVNTESIEREHLPFWILPADHVHAFWRSEINRWLFGFERQISTVISKDHNLSSQQQFINSATAAMFLRTLRSICGDNNKTRPLQIWKKEYKIKQHKKTTRIRRYGLGFEDSLKQWGMAFISSDLVMWETLTIDQHKLAKTAFFNSFGFELGFHKKVRHLGQKASKASEVQRRQHYEDSCLREYLASVLQTHEMRILREKWRRAGEGLDKAQQELKNAKRQALPQKILNGLQEVVETKVQRVKDIKARIANALREYLRLPTELVVQAYIRDLWDTLGGVHSRRQPVPGMKNLSEDIRDGRVGLTWITFLNILSKPGKLGCNPLVALPRRVVGNSQGNTQTLAETYTYDWKGKMDGLFRIKDNIPRKGWNKRPFREKIRRIYAMIGTELGPGIADIWEADIGEAASRYLWAIPLYDDSHLSVLEKATKHNSLSHQKKMKTKSEASRTKIILPLFRVEKLAEQYQKEIELLADLERAIGKSRTGFPLSGVKEEKIMQMVTRLRPELEEAQQVSLLARLKKLLERPGQYMDLVKDTEDAPQLDLDPPIPGRDGRDEYQSHTLISTYNLGGVPIFPIFQELMRLSTLDEYYASIEEKMEIENDEIVGSDSEESERNERDEEDKEDEENE